MAGGEQPDCLLDLAEFDTLEEAEEGERAEEGGVVDARLMAWLEEVAPLHRSVWNLFP